MAAKASDLTGVAREGYDAPSEASCPYIESSPSSMAWLTGQWLRKTGRTAPRDVRMSRGYTVRANDMLIDLRNPASIARIN